MSEYVIETQKLSVKVGHRFLLQDINWQVKAGENWVVFGMNGSGKTTLLSLIAGFRQATSGRLKVLGEEYNNENALALRSKIGWVSASFYDKIYTKESALDIVLSGKFGTLGVRGETSDTDIIRAKNLLKELKLADKINRPFDTMSKGERQNVLIARALFADPQILILDKPCTGLDLYNREHLFAILRELADDELTIIYVTHYVEEILEIFPKALFLRQGMTAACGKVEEVFTAERMSAIMEYPIRVYRDEDDRLRASAEITSNIKKIISGGEQK